MPIKRYVRMFTAAQAAQKRGQTRDALFNGFTAAQAAQKGFRFPASKHTAFTAAQAAQKTANRGELTFSLRDPEGQGMLNDRTGVWPKCKWMR